MRSGPTTLRLLSDARAVDKLRDQIIFLYLLRKKGALLIYNKRMISREKNARLF